MFTLSDVLEALTGQRPQDGRLRFSKAVVDAGQVTRGVLFIALPGEGLDGHEYVETAFEVGARGALIERELDLPYPTLDLRNMTGGITETLPEPPFCLLVEDCKAALHKLAHFWRRQLKVRVIGVTGSVGKSTTKDLVAQVLEQRYNTIRNPGNMDNSIGLPLTLLEMSSEHQRAVLEMNLYIPNEVARLSLLAQPQVGIITNITSLLVETNQWTAALTGSEETVPRSRVELVQALPPAPEGVAVLNFDDPWAREMARWTRARVFYYGLNPQADLWADGVESDGLEGIRFRLHFRNETLHLRVPLIGRYSVHTALRAAAVGLIEGLTWQEIVNGLHSGSSQLRLVTVRTASGALILDDTYSASPESTLAALNLLEELEGRKMAVLGEMLEVGPYEGQGHAMVGVRAAEIVDELVTLGERGRIIAASALSSGLSPEQVTAFDETSQVIDYLKGRLKPKDIVLVKGSSELHMERIAAALEDRE